MVTVNVDNQVLCCSLQLCFYKMIMTKSLWCRSSKIKVHCKNEQYQSHVLKCINALIILYAQFICSLWFLRDYMLKEKSSKWTLCCVLQLRFAIQREYCILFYNLMHYHTSLDGYYYSHAIKRNTMNDNNRIIWIISIKNIFLIKPLFMSWHVGVFLHISYGKNI